MQYIFMSLQGLNLTYATDFLKQNKNYKKKLHAALAELTA